MTELAKKLHDMIAQSGPVSIADYMQICLIDDEHGYYQNRPVFGKEGDFITAPEISQIFGEMLAAFHAHIFHLYNAPASAITFEAGPGRGTLSADMMRCYRAIAPELYEAPCYLWEASHALQEVQKTNLAPKEPVFMSSLSDLPQAPLFGVANEFFDALGVRQAIWHDGAWHERRIDSQKGAFHFIIAETLEDGADNWRLPAQAEDGDIFEYCPKGEEIMGQLAHHIAHYGGALLVIDYGKSGHKGDSLQAVRDHQPSDILSHQGEADITHWVDFAALADVAKRHHARLIGPVSQGRFLTELGIGERAEALRKPDDALGDRALVAAIDRLVSPAQMGEAFKVALLVPEGDGLPPGFMSLADR